MKKLLLILPLIFTSCNEAMIFPDKDIGALVISKVEGLGDNEYSAYTATMKTSNVYLDKIDMNVYNTEIVFGAKAGKHSIGDTLFDFTMREE
jgi:hypothetical protein